MKILLLLVISCSWVWSAPYASEVVMEEMALPESKVLDFDNLTESERTDLLRNQINITAVKLQQQLLRAAAAQKNMQRAGAPTAIRQSASEPNISSHVQIRKNIEKHIIGNIRHNIESNLMRNDSYGHAGATHEMAFSAVCDLPKHTNQSFWDDDYTWNLYFRLPHSKPYTSVNSAMLRLYMTGADNSTDSWNRRDSDNCKNPAEQMIRVTVSVYLRKKSKDNVSMERKKRICSSITITRNYRGWIALDTLLAVKLWDKPNRNFGIAVDVQDQDDNPLPAARFFQATDCTEASKTNATAAVLPWNFFRNSLSWTSDEMDDVPHVPRIDVMMKTIPQHPHYFTAHHQHPHHRMFRQHPQHQQQQKFHYGGSVRYRLENGSGGTATSSSGSSSSSSTFGNSYEMDETVEIKQHQPSVHAHHSMTKPHKKRHLQQQQQRQHLQQQQHHQDVVRALDVEDSGESEEYSLSSASLEERKL